MCEVSSFVQLCDILPQEYRNEFDVYGMWSTFELLSVWTKVNETALASNLTRQHSCGYSLVLAYIHISTF